MCKINVIRINKILNEDGKQVGIQYVDDVIDLSPVEQSNKLNGFIDFIDELISPDSSIILYRQDVKRLADKISDDYLASRDTFREIKSLLRSRYTVLKLSYNPRTQEFCGLKTAFILHWRD